MTTYYVLEYSSRAGGSFVEEGAFVTWNAAADSGWIVTDIDLGGNTGKMAIAIIDGSTVPDAADTLTQGGVTADVDLSEPMLYPAYLRDDVAVASSGAITWTGPAVGVSHSFFFDAQTANVVAGEILTFSGGQIAECITVESDAGATGELSVRFTSNLDEGLPVNDDTFTGDIAGDGTVNGEVHPRGYTPLEMHRLLADLNDDEDIAGDDDLSMVDPTASDRSTDQIVTLLGNINISDTVSQHMYGGSIDQAGGDTQYSGLDVQVTSPNADTQPVIVQYDPATGIDAIVTDYWTNAYFPDSIAGNVRILRKTRDDGVNIDGKRVRGKLLEFGDFYFTGSTTLGQATTSLALFSSNDGNNNTAVGTVAVYSPIYTEGYQLLDHLGGAGNKPYSLQIDFDTNTSLETYEHTKYVQRRGTAETLSGRNAQLYIGVNLDFAFDGQTTNLTEDEVVVWGTEVTYSNQLVSNFQLGEVVDFSPSGAKGRVQYDNDGGTSGTLVISDVEGTPDAADTILAATTGTTADVDAVTIEAASGLGVLVALDDGGATGNLYLQQIGGVIPVDNQLMYGRTSNGDATVNEPTGVNTRTINNQFVGVYTGTNYQTNFGIAIQPADAIAGDLFPPLDGTAAVAPPNNQTGEVTSLVVGDRVSVYPWDGSTLDVNGDAEPDFNEMTLATALSAGVSTVVDVGTGNIPDNTPSSGFLRIERDSDNNLDLVEYSSQDGDDEFTLVGTAPSAAAISNTVMRAFIDKVAASTTESYTAQFGPGNTQVAITVRRGGVNPIKTFKTTATFGSAGFSVGAVRTPDE